MWGRRREAQAETSLEAAAEGVAVSAAVSAALEYPAEARDTAMEVARHLEALSSPNLVGSADGAKPVIDANAAAPASRDTRPIIRANPISTAFGDMVALLSKSPAHKHLSLADLEWLLLPPVALNQFALADAKLPNGQTVLAGFVLWARVAPDVDARLSHTQRYPLRLQPNEWRSGDVLWIVDAVGEPKAVQQCIAGLTKTAFQGEQFKMLSSKSQGSDEASGEARIPVSRRPMGSDEA